MQNKINSKYLDEQLLLLQQNDINALANIYEHTKSALYGYLLSIVKNTSDAEDLLQNTYIKIYDESLNYNSVGKPLAWFFTIAKNLAYMELRKAKKTVYLESEQWYQIPAEIDLAINEKITLEQLLNKLDDTERQIIMLHVVSGLKFREVGVVMDISLSNVLSKYHRAMKKLKKIVEEGEHE